MAEQTTRAPLRLHAAFENHGVLGFMAARARCGSQAVSWHICRCPLKRAERVTFCHILSRWRASFLEHLLKIMD
jgi:hypothetical protein